MSHGLLYLVRRRLRVCDAYYVIGLFAILVGIKRDF